MSDMNFDDLAPQDYTFTYKQKDYELREPPEASVIAYRNAVTKGVKLDGNQKPTSMPDLMHEAESILLSGCVYEDDDKDGREVKLDTLRKWPGRIIKKLSEQAKSMAELDKEADPTSLRRRIAALQKQLYSLEANGEAEEERAKNSSSATVDASA